MDSDQLLHHIAQDFSMFLGDVLGLDDAPADEFFDPITETLGDNLTQQSIVEFYRSDYGPTKLSGELNEWLETNTVTPDVASQLLEFTIANNFGRDALA